MKLMEQHSLEWMLAAPLNFISSLSPPGNPINKSQMLCLLMDEGRQEWVNGEKRALPFQQFNQFQSRSAGEWNCIVAEWLAAPSGLVLRSIGCSLVIDFINKLTQSINKLTPISLFFQFTNQSSISFQQIINFNQLFDWIWVIVDEMKRLVGPPP